MKELHAKYEHHLSEFDHHHQQRSSEGVSSQPLRQSKEACEENVIGKGTLLLHVFPEGIQDIQKNLKLNKAYGDKAFLFGKVAEICREEILHKSTFTRKFSNEVATINFLL